MNKYLGLFFLRGALWAQENLDEDLIEKLKKVQKITTEELSQELPTEKVSLGSVLVQLGFGLVVVFLLIWVVTKVLKYMKISKGLNNGPLEFEVLKTFYLGPKQKIMLTDILGKKYLLGVTNDNIQVIDSDIEYEEDLNSKDFSQNVDQFLKRFKRNDITKNKGNE